MIRIVVETPDPRGSADFYAALLGWSVVTSAAGDLALADASGEPVAALRERPGPSRWVPSFPVDDLDRATGLCRAAGALVEIGAGPRAPVRVADLWGATFELFPDSGASEAAAARPAAIGLVDVAVDRAAEPVLFYGDLFGWDSALVDHGYRYFLDGGLPCAGLWSAEGDIGGRIWAESPLGWTVYLRVDDCDRVLAVAAELGAQIRVPTQVESPTGPFAFLRDPLGAGFGLVEPRSLTDLLADIRA